MSAIEALPETGLDLMRAVQTRAVPPPPFADLLGLELLIVEAGRTTFGFRPERRFSNWTTTHGGALAAVADFAVTTAVISALPTAGRVVTTNLTLTYLRPLALDSGLARCEGRLVHLGSSLAHAEASMTDDAGREILRASATCSHRA